MGKPQSSRCGLEDVVGNETEASRYSKMSEVNPQKTSCRTAQDRTIHIKESYCEKNYYDTEWENFEILKLSSRRYPVGDENRNLSKLIGSEGKSTNI